MKFKAIASFILSLVFITGIYASASTIPTYDCMGVSYDVYHNVNSISCGLIAVKNNSQWGFADVNGKLVIPCKFSEVSCFINQKAFVKLNQKWGVIDTKGNFILQPIYDKCPTLTNKQYSAYQGNTHFLFDERGNNLYDKYPGYDEFLFLSQNYIAVHNLDGWGIIDSSGKTIITPIYQDMPPTLINNNGLFGVYQYVKSEDKVYGGIIDSKGNVVLPFEYECTSIFVSLYGEVGFCPYYSDGLALVENKKTGNTSYIDTNGKVVFTLQQKQPVSFYNYPMNKQHFNFINGMCCITSNGKYGFIDKTGKTIISPQYDEVSDFRYGYCEVIKNGKWGIIDKQGKIVVPIIYDRAGNDYSFYGKDTTSGMFTVRKNKKYGVVDANGKIILPIIYDNSPSYNPNDGLFIVNKGGKFGFVNKNNKIVIPINYQSVAHFNSGIAKVKLENKYGYINRSGKIVVPIKYIALSYVTSNHIYAAEQSGVRYILDTAGRIVFKTKTGKVIE